MTTPSRFVACLSPFVLLVAFGCAGDAVRATGPQAPAGSPAGDLEFDQFGEWTAPVHLDAPVNSSYIDNSPQLSPDGLSLYFGSNRPDGHGSQDIWVARRACTAAEDPACAWQQPRNLPATVNSIGVDNGAELSRDGHWLYFTSSRADPSAYGSNDIWVSWRADTDDDLGWEQAVNVGAEVNSALFEAGPTLWGPELYFARGPGIGASGAPSDIWVREGEGQPARLVEELSVAGAIHDQRPTIRFDGREIFLTSNRAGGLGLPGGTEDIWVSSRATSSERWNAPENLGSVVNSSYRETTSAISEDGTELFFASDRPGSIGAAANFDIYVTTRTRRGEMRAVAAP